jgi:hypothetical protein
MNRFTAVVLFTAPDGRARFGEREFPLTDGSPAARLSQVIPASGLQFRQSPVGFESAFHCSPSPQWVFILSGTMEIGLQDGTARRFAAGEHFLSADTLPEGQTFDAATHGHRSRQVGDTPLVTLFVKE